MRDYLKGKYAALVARMEEKKDLSAEDEKELHDAIKDWKKNGTRMTAAHAERRAMRCRR